MNILQGQVETDRLVCEGAGTRLQIDWLEWIYILLYIYNSATEDTCLTLHTDIETSLNKRLVYHVTKLWWSHDVPNHFNSIDCYKQCQKLLDEKDHTSKRVGQRKSGEGGKEKNILTERLGNVWNELGVYYKHLSSTREFGEGEKLSAFVDVFLVFGSKHLP